MDAGPTSGTALASHKPLLDIDDGWWRTGDGLIPVAASA
jgi:hypothetical protein